MKQTYKFEVKPLPYGYDALAPYIEKEILVYHHDRHYAAYVEKLNSLLEANPKLQKTSLKELIMECDELPENVQKDIFNNAGGVFNHELYFALMTPDAHQKPKGILGKQINNEFGSFEDFKSLFVKEGVNRFGSGYAWLACDKAGKLSVFSLPNQNTPLNLGLCPLLLVDVWEHAYYLQYKNLRKSYIENWFEVVNWKAVEKIYEDVIK